MVQNIFYLNQHSKVDPYLSQISSYKKGDLLPYLPWFFTMIENIMKWPRITHNMLITRIPLMDVIDPLGELVFR